MQIYVGPLNSRGESFRVEDIGLFPETGMPVQAVDADGDYGIRRNIVAADFIFAERPPPQCPGRREHAQAFVQHHAGVGQLLQVRITRASPAQGCAYLRRRRSSACRILGKQIPGPGEGAGGRLVTGQHQGQDLAAQLIIVHAIAGLFITGLDQGTEQVAAILEVALALLNDAIHHCVQSARPS